MGPLPKDRLSENELSIPPAPTGCEYYFMIRTDLESSPGVPIYRKRMLPVDPRLEPGGSSTLDTLDEHQFAAVESLLKERNAQTAENGQWIVSGLSMVKDSGSFRFKIEFYEYGAPADFRGTRKCLTMAAVEDKRATSGNQQQQSVPDFPSNPISGSSDIASSIGPRSPTPGSELDSRALTPVPSQTAISALPNSSPNAITGVIQDEPPMEDTRTQNEILADELHEIEDLACKVLKSPGGQKWEALRILKRVLDGRKKIMGEEHHGTLITTVNWWYNRFLLGDTIDQKFFVRQVLEEAWEGLERALGGADKNTLAALHALAASCDLTGDPELACAYFENALRYRASVLGKKHEDTVDTMDCLLKVYNRYGWQVYPERIAEFLIDYQTEVLGKTHETTLNTIECIASSNAREGQLKEAEAWMKELLKRREEKDGPDNPSTEICMCSLADIRLKRIQL